MSSRWSSRFGAQDTPVHIPLKQGNVYAYVLRKADLKDCRNPFVFGGTWQDSARNERVCVRVFTAR